MANTPAVAEKPKTQPKGIVEPLTVVQRVMTIGSKINVTKTELQSLQEKAQAVAAKIPTVNDELVAKYFSGAAIEELDAYGKVILEKLDDVVKRAKSVTKKLATFLKTPAAVTPVAARAVTTAPPTKVP